MPGKTQGTPAADSELSDDQGAGSGRYGQCYARQIKHRRPCCGYQDVVAGGGGDWDLWSPLPQTIYLDGGGSFQYTFNHSFVDVLLFLQGDVDLSTLGNGFTNDQVFRIAVVPSEFADANLTMEQIMNSGDFEFIGN